MTSMIVITVCLYLLKLIISYCTKTSALYFKPSEVILCEFVRFIATRDSSPWRTSLGGLKVYIF